MTISQPKIASVAIGIIQTFQTAQAIYTIVANTMDAVESQKSEEPGHQKKAWVLAYVKSVTIALGENWDELAEEISKFIDQIKLAYNSIKVLF